MLLDEKFVMNGELFDVFISWHSNDNFSIDYQRVEYPETLQRRTIRVELVEYVRTTDASAFRRK